MSISRTCHVWYLLVVLLTLLAEANKISTIEAHGKGLVHSCIGLNQSEIELCGMVEVNGDIMANEGNCAVEDCRETCCSSVNKCFNTNFFTTSRIDCVASRLNHKFGSCCKIKQRNYNKCNELYCLLMLIYKNCSAKVIYTAGALGIGVATTGLYMLTISKKTEEELFDSSYDDEDDPLINIKDVNPHLDVKKIIATDGNDVFWDDKQNL
ncbi:hypothetical protein TOT_020000235 [Theileria orientalis strain Shintoku]|uniref:Uncharacterized protein n=1 Tax=Theileria orientalis strain Shintoku TaxID=869250 RepID=J4C809_THEOR|nr:hypothetical protein TOT_020000235 [Theileria orientalis strain Shintoku]BAM39968.1 hypothetical protein TOT_020000235 [Theileria orientalis strain Shintoku]|eukprot:XP_009690269.1 hypothetical protein TOT_020000235 [Theileria orientalis strain Shintoku]